MRGYINDFYKSKGLEMHKLVQRNRRNLSEQRILMAASDIYGEIERGRKIPDIQLAWEVWRKAFSYSEPELESRLNDIEDYLNRRDKPTLISIIKAFIARLTQCIQ